MERQRVKRRILLVGSDHWRVLVSEVLKKTENFDSQYELLSETPDRAIERWSNQSTQRVTTGGPSYIFFELPHPEKREFHWVACLDALARRKERRVDDNLVIIANDDLSDRDMQGFEAERPIGYIEKTRLSELAPSDLTNHLMTMRPVTEIGAANQLEALWKSDVENNQKLQSRIADSDPTDPRIEQLKSLRRLIEQAQVPQQHDLARPSNTEGVNARQAFRTSLVGAWSRRHLIMEKHLEPEGWYCTKPDMMRDCPDVQVKFNRFLLPGFLFFLWLKAWEESTRTVSDLVRNDTEAPALSEDGAYLTFAIHAQLTDALSEFYIGDSWSVGPTSIDIFVLKERPNWTFLQLEVLRT